MTEAANAILPSPEEEGADPACPAPAGPLIYRAKHHAAVRTDEYLYNQLIPYIGNKRKLLRLIAEAIRQTGITGGTFVDYFAGSSVVARLAKTLGYRVVANDWEPYAHILNQCYVQCNTMPAFAALGGVERAFALLNAATPIEGYVARHLCPRDDACPDPATERMFFTHANGGKIDAMREQIRGWEQAGALSTDETAVLLAALVYAVSYTSNTSGVFKGFHRGWGGQTGTALYRILSTITLRPPTLHDNGLANRATQLDAQALAEALRAAGEAIAVAYLDPPYNQHPYGSNYHVLNTVVLGDQPRLSPLITARTKSAIRTDWRTARRSAYNYAGALAAYDLLLQTIQARAILTSYSTDGNMPLREMLDCAARRGALRVVTRPYKRYRVSSQRMSRKPINAEFVLIIDPARPATRRDVARVLAEIRQTEAAALAAHQDRANG
jgi:adenine-specific DNA-methyltransferase